MTIHRLLGGFNRHNRIIAFFICSLFHLLEDFALVSFCIPPRLRDNEVVEPISQPTETHRALVFPHIRDFQCVGDGLTLEVCVKFPSIEGGKFSHDVPHGLRRSFPNLADAEASTQFPNRAGNVNKNVAVAYLRSNTSPEFDLFQALKYQIGITRLQRDDQRLQRFGNCSDLMR